MSCAKETRSDIVLLAAGLLDGPRALRAEAHLAGCPVCAALRLAVLEERAALKDAGAPLVEFPEHFLAGLPAPVRLPADVPALTLAGAALAAGLAILLVLVPLPDGGSPAPSGPSLTQSFINPFGASMGGGADGTDFLYQLSARAPAGPGAGPAPADLKEDL